MIPRWAIALAAATEACSWGCGASTQDVQAATYVSAQQVCVAQAKDMDGGLECLHEVKAVFCGPGGVWADAGVCEGGIQ